MSGNKIYEVPLYQVSEYSKKKTKYCLCIPIINEGNRIKQELLKAKENGIDKLVDIIICDGDSTDGSTKDENLKKLGVNTLLIKKDSGKQGAQLRMGFDFALKRGYDGIITIDGNNKDSIEDVPKFIEKLDEGYDFVQGSRFVKGGQAINTPLVRHVSLKLLHAPIISLTAGERFTDTTNAYRAYSAKYLTHPDVNPFRKIFVTYELLAYLSVKASQLGLKTCEIPVRREYPKKTKTPTKISFFKGNYNLLKILFKNMKHEYDISNNMNNNLFCSFIFSFQIFLMFLYLIPSSNFSVSTFNNRIIGNGLLNNMDVSKRVFTFLIGGIILSLFTYIFGKIFNMIMQNFDKKFIHAIELTSILGIASSIFDFINYIIQRQTSTYSILTLILLMISIFCFVVPAINIVFNKDIKFDDLKCSIVSAIPILFFISLGFHKLNIFNRCKDLAFMASYIITVIVALKICTSKNINQEVFKKSYIFLMIMPIIESMFLELYNILNQYNIIIIHKYFLIFLIYILGFIGFLIYYIYHKNKKINFNFEKIYYPLVIATFVLFAHQLPMTNYITTDFFEQSNHGTSIYEFLKFNKIPLIENYDAHMLQNEIGGILYGILNSDFFGAIFLSYNEIIINLLLLLLTYFLFNKIFSKDMAILFTLFLPLNLDNGLTAYMFALLPIILLINLINNKTFWRFFLYILSVALACIWRLDIGFSVALSTLMILILNIIKSTLKQNNICHLLMSILIIGMSFIGIYLIICIAKNINPMNRIIEFLSISSSNINWGYKELGNSHMLVYTLMYFIFPIIVIFLLLNVIRNKSRYNQNLYIILVSFILFYIFNFQRGMIRHSLVENQIHASISFLILIFSLIIYNFQKNKSYIFVISYLILMIVFSLFITPEIPNFQYEINQSLNRYLSFQIHDELYYEKTERLILSDEMKNEYTDLSKVMSYLLDDDESFIDMTNQTLLYPLLNRKKPVYINQSPGLLSGEKSQHYFIDEINQANTPLLIKSKTKLLSNELDGVPNDYRYYLISEYTYRNFKPIAIVNDYEIWVRKQLANKYIEKLNKIHINNMKLLKDDEEYYKLDNKAFNLVYIPSIWASYDKSYRKNNNILYNFNVNKNNIYNIKLDNINKEDGNYLVFDIDNDADLNNNYLRFYLSDEVNRYEYIFCLNKTKGKYAIRISTLYEWYSDKELQLQIEQTDGLTINDIYILKGDLAK